MTCANCGSALPDGAFFCGECGRAVSAAAPARPFLEQTMQPTRISEPEARDSWWTSDVPSVDDVPAPRGAESPEDDRETCGVCGAAMSGADIFCGECGNVSRTVSSAFSSTRDTATLRSDPATGADPEPIALERAQGERFILQFSTGESVAVFGTGLIGRNPLAEPGEYFDQVVRMLDPTRSGAACTAKPAGAPEPAGTPESAPAAGADAADAARSRAAHATEPPADRPASTAAPGRCPAVAASACLGPRHDQGRGLRRGRSHGQHGVRGGRRRP
jgi:predicted nucleic acid-binding Zn ribbon protein